jgi:pimeloyl-ACP methyl ester carboxylesterase
VIRAIAALCALAGLSTAMAAEEVVTLPTRVGVTLAYLLVTAGAAEPRYVLLSFIGGRGAINLRARQAKGATKFGPGANALIRMRGEITDADFAQAIVDAPSDRLPDGLDDAFRLGAAHAEDSVAVVRDLRRRHPQAKVYVLGTSKGTLSAASFAARHPDLVEGVVLTSTVSMADRMGVNLSRFDFGTLKVPVLLVHHRDDGCRSSPYAGAQRLAARFPITTVEGGDPPQSGPCEPQSPHGFLGREAGTAGAIKRWIASGAVTAEVH